MHKRPKTPLNPKDPGDDKELKKPNPENKLRSGDVKVVRVNISDGGD